MAHEGVRFYFGIEHDKHGLVQVIEWIKNRDSSTTTQTSLAIHGSKLIIVKDP